jgi:hypothetical protein
VSDQIIKALSALGVFAFLGGVVAAYWKRSTDKVANELAQKRLLWEQDRQEREEASERLQQDADRRDELREDLKACRERCEALENRNAELETLYQARLSECRAREYPCQIPLKTQVHDIPPMPPTPPSGGPPDHPTN